jgi:hypothetical protein
VYDTSILAARAYNVVQDYLRKYRTECKITKDTPKEELSTVFTDARRIADEAVQRLRRDLNMAGTIFDDQAVVDAGKTHGNTMNLPSRPIRQEDPPPETTNRTPPKTTIPPEVTNVIPLVEDPPLEQVSIAEETKSEPAEVVVDNSPNEDDIVSIVPTSSVNQVTQVE